MMIDRGDRDVCVALTTNVKLCEDHFRVVDTLLVLKKTSQELRMLSRSLFCLCLCLSKVSHKSPKSLSKVSQKSPKSLSKVSQKCLLVSTSVF